MKNRGTRDGEKISGTNFSKSITSKKKNIQRLGGGGLSLEAFANAKSTNSSYNPALIKKQREFYKNAKYVSKYKKSLKQQNDISSASRPLENENETGDGGEVHVKDRKKKNNKKSLKELYEKKRNEEEKARIEKEAILQAKREKREKAEAERKATREKMFKKTRFGQPVMKYRIEHLLQSIQNSN